MGACDLSLDSPCLFVVIGTRPEAIKMAPILWAASARGLRTCICITNQHPDLLPGTMAEMKLVAQAQADIGIDAIPNVSRLQAELRHHRPACVVVQGDTRSAFAGALAASLERVPLAHVEAGLRTNRLLDPWPEELFRRAIARLTEFHFAPTPSAAASLQREGYPRDRVWLTGNPVVDHLTAFDNEGAARCRSHILLTAHRSETDLPALVRIIEAASRLSRETGLPVLHVGHPRFRNAPSQTALPGLHPLPPQAPADFLTLLRGAVLVLTDSGGVQEEAAISGIPALILRERTERPELLAPGFAELVGGDGALIVSRGRALIENPGQPADASVLGDGKAGSRIVEILARQLTARR